MSYVIFMNKYLRNSIVTTNMNVIFIVILNAITFEKDLSRNSWTMFVSSIKNNISLCDDHFVAIVERSEYIS